MNRPLAIVFDSETTGLTQHPKAEADIQPRIIEFAGILTDGVEILDVLEFKCNPGIPLEAIITKITGLKDSDLEHLAPFGVQGNLDALAAFFAKGQVSIAHNHSFDRDLLKYDLARFGHKLSDINFPEWNVCTVEQTMHRYGYGQKLAALYEEYVGPYVQKHRALDDIMLLHRVCQEIKLYRALGVTA
jgi:DNA polymerase III alpha subunit (gram-positive type)